jgi:hypothetical protein
MRSILAVGVLLIAVNVTVPDTNHAEPLIGTSNKVILASLEEAPPPDSSAPALTATIPAAATSEAAHDQGEAPAEPPLTPAPAVAEGSDDADVTNSVDGLCNTLLASAQDNDLPVPFFANLIWQESRLRNDSVSRAGAQGIAQFMPSVAAEVGLADPFDPRQALPASARFLRTLREQFGNLGYVAAAYNAGSHRVGLWLKHRRSLPRETVNYVMRVTGRSIHAWRKAPVADSKLGFASHLPCRALPTFAALDDPSVQSTDDGETGTVTGTKPTHAALRKFRIMAVAVLERIEGHRGSAMKLARNLRGMRHDVMHRQIHAPHERRRLAQATVVARAD